MAQIHKALLVSGRVLVVASWFLLGVHSIAYAQAPRSGRIAGLDTSAAMTTSFQTPGTKTPLQTMAAQSGGLAILPGSPVVVENCVPFGGNTDFGFTGFIYRNVQAFSLLPGMRIRFDLGAATSQDVRRNIYFAVANKNPAPAAVVNDNVVPQGIRATQWVQVVSDAQTPSNPRGDATVGNFEGGFNREAQQ